LKHISFNTYLIRITGTVQGVGFRPFIYQLAHKLHLKGEVRNDSAGVTIVVNAIKEQLDTFITQIKTNLPPLAKIDSLELHEVTTRKFETFSIVQSENLFLTSALIPPDIAICKACEKELFDPTNRRYLHPFITCTDCGVRYSIIEKLPYDRKNTSMRFFPMCEACQKEYNDPTDRRYHAQPIGCHECGPKLSMSIDEAVRRLHEGEILAVKGVGGYHLVCDATNEAVVIKLRECKRRPAKPFAVMVRELKEAKALAQISEKEEALLISKERPIVLLRSKNALPESVAPGISKIGLFLAYTPLHILLLEKLQKPIVATSANVTDEPIATTRESLEKLRGVYDAVLDHDREIVNGCDDSVAMVVNDQVVMIRRARGYAPASVKLPKPLPQKVLALGANQKSTVAIGFEKEAILSPHIGDLESIESLGYYEKNIETLRRVYDFTPDLVVCDKHPGYESTKYAKANFSNVKQVQHHYAHIFAVMAEKGITGEVLGVAFDGTGYGDDGNLWGGEFLRCDMRGYERMAHFRYFRLLGGTKAIKEPRRVALSLLFDLYGEKALTLPHPTVQSFSPTERKTLYLSWQKGLNAPLSSSCGRIFDAVASLTDVCQVMSFEGESGMLLEELYDESVTESYETRLHEDVIDFLPMIEAILHEANPRIAVSKFFNTLVETVVQISDLYDLPVILSGGVFQNRILLELLLKRLPNALIPNEVPPNDGGIALGQVVSLLDRSA